MKFGLIGKSLKHSLSQTIHTIFFEEIGLVGSYEYYELEEIRLGDALKEFEHLGLNGINVTIPYKIKIMDYIDVISREAKAIGSINTIRFIDGIREGYNTDYYGFKMLLENFRADPEGKICIVLGTGGASKAVVKLLEDKLAKEIILVSRDKGNKGSIGTDHKVISYEELAARSEIELLINTTPVGMYPDVLASPVSRDIVKKAKVVIDIIYNPDETTLIKYAREEGIAGANGLYMLVGQAVAAQEIWNNCKYDSNLVDRIHERLKLHLEVKKNV